MEKQGRVWIETQVWQFRPWSCLADSAEVDKRSPFCNPLAPEVRLSLLEEEEEEVQRRLWSRAESLCWLLGEAEVD